VNQDSATVCLELESRPECVTLVRSALSGLGERLGLDAELLDDLKTAVSEACNNVVIHAYRDETGPLTVRLDITADGVDVLVRDRGSGIRRVAPNEDRMGVGLAVISALADRAEFLSGPDGGTDVRMSFTRGGAGLQLADGALGASTGCEPVQLPGDVGNHFSVDRFSDLYPIADAIAAHAQRAAADDRPITVSINSENRRLELALAPFEAGSGSRLESSLSAQPGSSPLVGLADGLEVERINGDELLRVVVLDRR
jgi:serine/threonine-protein kinase RsbW